MDIQAYLASGILEEYILGHLSEERQSEVARLCSEYPQLETERHKIEETLFAYASSQAVMPPFQMQDQIWETLENLTKERSISLTNLPLINAFSDHKKWL